MYVISIVDQVTPIWNLSFLFKYLFQWQILLLKQSKTKIEYFETYCNEFINYKKDNIKYIYAKTLSVDRTITKEFIESHNDACYILIKRNIVENFISHERLKKKEWNVEKKIDKFAFNSPK